jgi:hypothetical protein
MLIDVSSYPRKPMDAVCAPESACGVPARSLMKCTAEITGKCQAMLLGIVVVSS